MSFLKHNDGQNFTFSKTLDIYDHHFLVDYPRDSEGDIMAMVHHERQDKDFDLINSGDQIFLTLDGEVVFYEGETLCTVFINEAAYYEKGFALCLAQKTRVEIKE